MRIVESLASILIASTLSFTIAQEQIPSTDELLKNVPELANIPGLANFNTSSIKTEDVEKLFREKCEKNGGPTAFDTAKDSPQVMINCFQSLVNVTQLEAEMAAARPKGDLDTVFTKYCRRVPNLKRCVKNVTDTIEPCLEAEERDHVNIVHNITSSLLEFICHNEGDRIAMFIAAGGRECLSEKNEKVQKCANETFHSYIPASNSATGELPTLSSIPLLVLSLKECTDIEKFRTCTVEVLEECKDPTPANVIESMFNFVKRVTPCENLLKSQASPVTGTDNPNSSTSVVNALFTTIAMLLFLRFA